LHASFVEPFWLFEGRLGRRANLDRVGKELPPSQRRRLERERTLGLDPEDEAAKWIEENAPERPAPEPKAGRKSVTLHRWRQAQLRKPR
jgi:hypothetical protein